MDTLHRHLQSHLGRWPADTELDIVGWRGRAEPGWDGSIHPVLGVASPEGGVLSVAPDRLAAVADVHTRERSLSRMGDRVPAAVGLARRRWYDAVFRWSTDPEPLPDAG